jgi:hypothetical protein
VWSLQTSKVDAGTAPRAKFTIHLPRGDVAVIQERRASMWVRVATLHPGPGGKGTVFAPRARQGVDRYRIAVLRGRRTVAESATRTVYAYAPVTLATFTGREPSTLDVNGQQFTYVAGVFRHQDGTGVSLAPRFSTVLTAANTTCRTVTLQVAAVSETLGASGGSMTVSVVQQGARAGSVDLSANEIAPLAVALTSAPWQLDASMVNLAQIQNGQETLDVAVNGSLSCYTRSGR